MVPIHQPLGIDHCNCFTVRKAARLIFRFCDAHLQPTGLRITQFLILATLNEVRSAAVNELAERFDIERRRQENAWLFRARQPREDSSRLPLDGRTRIIELTHQGQALFETAEPVARGATSVRTDDGTENARALRAELTDMVVGYAVAL